MAFVFSNSGFALCFFVRVLVSLDLFSSILPKTLITYHKGSRPSYVSQIQVKSEPRVNSCGNTI